MTARQEFPFLPQWLIAEKREGIPSRMRPFGESARDLSVGFRLARRPEIITDLLSVCSEAEGPLDRGLWLQLPVGMRIEALLWLASLTDKSPFGWRVRCDSDSCGQENEFELTLDQILSLGNENRELETIVIRIGEGEATLRRPNGSDQMQWLNQPSGFESEAMLRSILLHPTLEQLLEAGHSLESIASAIDNAMETFDPLLGLRVSVVCPQCGAAKDVSPDLAGAALERLSRAQRVAIENVHRLASHYHWSETEILELPEWRRQSYLELIEAEVQ